MAWMYLFVAGIFEVVWAIELKYTEGFTRLWPTALTLAAMVLSFFFLAQALKDLPVGTAYAVWTGIGTVGTGIIGILVFGESRDLARVACILLVVAGIVGLRLVERS